MIRLMKNHMLAKLNSRYDAGKIEYLKQCTYLDPRFKNKFDINMDSFTERVKKNAMSYTEVIHPTEKAPSADSPVEERKKGRKKNSLV